jgi:DNA-binding NarL/FixJ family response regulator
MAEAQEAVADKPDLILLDYTLPDGTGTEILRSVRNGDSAWADSVPVLMFTQHDDPEKIADSVSAGAQAYMVKKDITVSEVVEKIKKQLDITS